MAIVDQTGIMSVDPTTSVAGQTTGLVDPTASQVGGLATLAPVSDYNTILKQRQDALQQYAPPVKTQDQVMQELQSTYGADKASEAARNAALTTFGSDLAASKADNILMAFTEAAPAFNQSLAAVTAKEQQFKQAMAEKARAEAMASAEAKRQFDAGLASSSLARSEAIQDSVYKARADAAAKGVDYDVMTVFDQNDPNAVPMDIMYNKKNPAQRFTMGPQGLTPFVPTGNQNFVKATSDVINKAREVSYSKGYNNDGTITRAFDDAIKDAPELTVQVANVKDDRTNPRVISSVRAKDLGPSKGGLHVIDPDTNQWTPVRDVYPFHSMQARDDLVEDTSNKYRSSVNFIQDIVLGEGDNEEVFQAGDTIAIPKTTLGDAFVNGKQVPNMFDQTYKENQESGMLFGREEYNTIGLADLTDKQAEEAKADMINLQTALSGLRDIIGTSQIMDDSNKDLFGAWNGMRDVLGNRFVAPLGNFVFGDVAKQQLSSNDVGRARNLFAQINRDLIRASLIGSRGPVYEQEILRELFKAEEGKDINFFADITTMEQLLVVESYLANRLNRVRQVFRDTDLPMIQANPLASTSFTTGDNPTLNIAYGVNKAGETIAVPASEDANDYTLDNMGMIKQLLDTSMVRDRNDIRKIPAAQLQNILKNKYVTIGRSTAVAFKRPDLAEQQMSILQALPLLGFTPSEIQRYGLNQLPLPANIKQRSKNAEAISSAR